MIQLKPLDFSALDDAFPQKSLFTHLKRDKELPPSWRSPLRPEQASMVNSGVSNMVLDFLTGKVSIKTDEKATLFTHSSGFSGLAMRRGEGKLVMTGTEGSWQELALLTLACAMTTPLFPSTFKALLHLTKMLERNDLRYPFKKSLQDISDTGALQALCILCDTIDAELSDLDSEEKIMTIERPVDSRIDEGLQDFNIAQGLAPRVQEESSPLSRLRRLIRRGGAALLVGPPGTFKTETAKRAAVESGAALVIAKGSPGVEDRDFLGGVYPLAGGDAWVDGPISRAFASAAQKKTVLLIDEALRYLPENLGVLIGAMDTVSAAELMSLGLGQQPEGRYYVLPLPNGEHLCCPAHQLTWILTTNMGADHHQQADRLDAALLSRLDLELYFDVPKESEVKAIYASVSTPELADLGYRAEVLTRNILKHDARALERPLEARKVIAMLKEAQSIMEEGKDVYAAFHEAFTITALPYCCKRDDRGKSEYGMSDMLMQRLSHEVLGGRG